MTTTSSTLTPQASTLRRLYLARSGFAIVWAALLTTTASDLGSFAAVLLVVYPLFDAAAAVVDLRSAPRPLGPAANIGISTSPRSAWPSPPRPTSPPCCGSGPPGQSWPGWFS